MGWVSKDLLRQNLRFQNTSLVQSLVRESRLTLMSALTCLFETILKERNVLSHVLF